MGDHADDAIDRAIDEDMSFGDGGLGGRRLMPGRREPALCERDKEIRLIAGEILGLEFGMREFESGSGCFGSCVKEPAVNTECGWRPFNPYHYMDDAFQVAEKIGGLKLAHNKATNEWVANFTDLYLYQGAAEKPAHAITMAALSHLDALKADKEGRK